jgi:putative ABC transport system ATP-binding protein
MMQQTSLVQAQGVGKAYRGAGGTVQALQAVDLTVHAGELVALVGPTGSGKTTLLRVLAGLLPPDRGSITLQGQRLDGLTDDALTDATERAHALVETLGLTALADRYPPDLSGGQQQLVAIARALAANPPLLLADEPTANLDSSTARTIVNHLRALADRGDHGILLATHDLRTASQADRVLTLRDGQIIKETRLQLGRSTQEVLAELA